MRKTPKTAIILGLLLTGLALFAVLWLSAWLIRPDVSEPPHSYTQEEIRRAEAARDIRFDSEDPLVLHCDVDYAKGESARWYPKGESPILAGLVEVGKLPPVEERVGPEPCVMRGVDGIGEYGGTWLRVATSEKEVNIITWRLSYASLVRWSPFAYPICPHVAKRVERSPDRKTWTVTLRRGIRWSDGHPFTAEDILYWWEDEINDTSVFGVVPDWMKIGGEPGTVRKIDDFRIAFVFPKPYGLFREMLARWSYLMLEHPAHYLRQFHPRLGDDEIIEDAMTAYKLPSRTALYTFMKDWQNPEHPRLWPWVYRTYKPNPPQVFVRNPYYYVVDEEGNQLPYVDRLQFDVVPGQMLGLSAANGLVTMQTRHIRYSDYTELMTRRERSATRILHWYSATRSIWVINPNLLRRIDPDDPSTRYKAELLRDPRFRKALSLAINRQDIIQAEYNDQVEPAQIAPGPESPFHHERLRKAYIDYDPERANRMLDALGLTRRDYEGYRTFPDGSRMTFYLDYCTFTGFGPAQFVVEDWADVGIRAIPRERSRTLFYAEKEAMDFDFNVWTGASDYLPLSSPRHFVAFNRESFYAYGWGRWFMLGGYYDSEDSRAARFVGPPRDHPMYRAMTAYEQALQAPTFEQQRDIFREALDIAADNLWTINIAEAPPQLVVVKKGFRNVPDNALYGHIFFTPGNAGIETYYFERPKDSPGAIAETRQAILEATPRPGAESLASRRRAAGRIATVIVKALLVGIVAVGVVLAALRHPYIARRLLIMVPTLLIISVLVFVIIQLPPGDYLSTMIMMLQESGDPTDLQKIEDLRAMFRFDEPAWKNYLRWLGVYWFATFDGSDTGLLQGNMGRSMESTREVNEIVGDRILLTFLISFGTILFTWAVAIPIGIYSAVRQYSIGDYVLTFIGFIGMCVPPFLLALVLMAISGVSGLFSAEYAAQPEWTWGKVVDLLRHIWIPIVVLGVGGTAGMIRVMRANLLDELKKPYVITAMAKGVRPGKLLLKYPVRLALNPFVSGIGGLFPQLVSGGAIVAMVLALPTVGPLMLAALFSEDMYLAGSMLMVLSLLGVFGTLVSDLLLLWLDPRIRFKGGTR